MIAPKGLHTLLSIFKQQCFRKCASPQEKYQLSSQESKPFLSNQDVFLCDTHHTIREKAIVLGMKASHLASPSSPYDCHSLEVTQFALIGNSTNFQLHLGLPCINKHFISGKSLYTIVTNNGSQSYTNKIGGSFHKTSFQIFANINQTIVSTLLIETIQLLHPLKWHNQQF